MAYTPTTWVQHITPADAPKLNKIEQGLADASIKAEDALFRSDTAEAAAIAAARTTAAAYVASQPAVVDAAAMAASTAVDNRVDALNLAAEGQRLAQILTDTAPDGSRAALERVGATDYRFWQELGRGYWWRFHLRLASTFPNPPHGTSTSYQLYVSDVVDTTLSSVGQGDPSVVAVGTWAPGTHADSFGGNYIRSNVAGDSLTFTSPANTVKVGLRSITAANGGFSKVTIDGGAAVANRLPTAAQLVDWGVLPASVLVANGGTLNPSDRMLRHFEFHGAVTDWDAPTLLADNLFPGVHTVKLEVSGYKHAQSSDTRAYVAGFSWATDTSRPAPPSGSAHEVANITPRDSAWEYAHRIKPAGATYAFVGNIHGFEQQSYLTFAVDGVTRSPAVGELLLGRTVTARRVTSLRHPDTGTTSLAAITTDYAVSGNGLRIKHETQWLVDLEVDRSYPVMFPLNKNTFSLGTIDTATVDWPIVNDDGAAKGYMPGNAVMAWEPFGDLAAVAYVPDLTVTVNDYADAPTTAMFVEDRARDGAGISMTKLYAARVGAPAPVTVAPMEVWHSDAVYRIAVLPRGADAVMSNNA